MKRLIYIAVIVAMLAIMMVPPMTDSYVSSATIMSSYFFSEGNWGDPLYILAWVYAYEQPYTELICYVYIYGDDIWRVFPGFELYSEGPDEATTDVLGKYYFEEGIGAGDRVRYAIKLRQDAGSPAVFGKFMLGVAAGLGAGPYGKVLNIQFHFDGRAPTIAYDEDASQSLENQMWQPEGSDPFGFYSGTGW